MPKAILVDITRCTGCRSCITACRNWNGLGFDKTAETWDMLGPTNFMTVRQKRTYTGDKLLSSETYYKYQCFHCADPACLKACPARAIVKYENGPVVVDQEKCAGVRLCVEACPWRIPAFRKETNTVVKCTMCHDRINLDPPLPPACVLACPSKAMTFGDRDTLLKDAKGKFGYVYGEDTETGGSSWLYGSSEALTSLKPEHGVAAASDIVENLSHPLGQLIVVGTAVVGGLYLMSKRSEQIKYEKAAALRKAEKPEKMEKPADEFDDEAAGADEEETPAGKRPKKPRNKEEVKQ